MAIASLILSGFDSLTTESPRIVNLALSLIGVALIVVSWKELEN
jgi:hypothetical protein